MTPDPRALGLVLPVGLSAVCETQRFRATARVTAELGSEMVARMLPRTASRLGGRAQHQSLRAQGEANSILWCEGGRAGQLAPMGHRRGLWATPRVVRSFMCSAPKAMARTSWDDRHLHFANYVHVN